MIVRNSPGKNTFEALYVPSVTSCIVDAKSCRAIKTYSGQGLSAPGVFRSHHSIIHTGVPSSPTPPRAIQPTRGTSLDPMSTIDYTDWYEFNMNTNEAVLIATIPTVPPLLQLQAFLKPDVYRFVYGRTQSIWDRSPELGLMQSHGEALCPQTSGVDFQTANEDWTMPRFRHRPSNILATRHSEQSRDYASSGNLLSTSATVGFGLRRGTVQEEITRSTWYDPRDPGPHEHNAAIFIFTTVCVSFLPLSMFIALAIVTVNTIPWPFFTSTDSRLTLPPRRFTKERSTYAWLRLFAARLKGHFDGVLGCSAIHSNANGV